MISWEKMISYLDADNMLVYTQNDEEAEYGGILTLIETRQLILSNQLFFIRSNAFPDVDLSPENLKGNISIALYMEETTPDNVKEELLSCLKNITNCIIFSNDSAFYNAYTTLNKLFSIHAQMHSAITSLSQKVAKNKGIQELVDIVAKVFNNPVNITDNAYIVTASSTLEINDPYVDELFHLDVVESNVLSTLKSRGLLKKIYSTSQAVDVSLFNRQSYAIAIRYANVTLGILSIFEANQTIDPMMLSYLPEMVDLIAFEMSKDSDPNTEAYNNFTYLFASLLKRKTNTSKTILKKRFASFGYTLKQNVYLLYLDLQNASVLPNQMHVIARQLQSVFKNSCFCIYHGNLLFLLSRNDDDNLSKEEIHSWESRLTSSGYRVGISDMFHDFDNFHMHYTQAMEACAVGKTLYPNNCVYAFSKMRIPYIAHCLTAEHEEPEMFLYPPLMKLLEFDIQNESNLTETLYYYLENPKNTDDICQKLYIHKNTLFYRMKKAREIMGTDMYKAEDITQISFSFQILRNLHKLPF